MENHEALRRREPYRGFNQRKKAGTCYGRRECGNNFGVIFQGLLFHLGEKNRILKKKIGSGLLGPFQDCFCCVYICAVLHRELIEILTENRKSTKTIEIF